jgi:hypothetical protein
MHSKVQRKMSSSFRVFERRELDFSIQQVIKCIFHYRSKIAFLFLLFVLRNKERTNVAITRARRHLIIVGSASTLSTDANWAHIVHVRFVVVTVIVCFRLIDLLYVLMLVAKQCRDDGAIFQPPKLTKQFTFVNT